MANKRASGSAPTTTSTHLVAQLPERRTVEGTNVLQLEIRPELFKALDPSSESVTGVQSWRLDLDTVSRNIRHQAIGAELADAGALSEAVTAALWVKPETATGQILQIRTREAQNGEAAVAVVLVDGSLHLVFRFSFPNVEDRGDEVLAAEPVPLAPGSWHRIAVLVGTARVQLHVDGATVAEIAFDAAKMSGGPSYRHGVHLEFGGWPVISEAGSELLTFNVADVRIWNVALSDDAIAHDRLRAGSAPPEHAVVGLGSNVSSNPTAHWEPALEPALYLIEHYQMDIVPGATGLGKIAKTITLLPGERTTTFISSVREVAVTSEARQSVLDSASESTQRSFDREVRSEHQRERSTNTESNVASSTSYEVSATASGSWGWGSASVSSSVSGSTSSSRSVARARRDVSSSVRASVAKTARSANSRRDLQIETTERTESTERDVESIERNFHNPSSSRTMTAVFRQINQRHLSFLQLVDVRIGYSEGAGIAIESSLANLDAVLGAVLTGEADADGTAPADDVRAYIEAQYERSVAPTLDAGILSIDVADVPFLVPADGGLVRNPNAGGSALVETGTVVPLSGALIEAFGTVMRTDNVAAESVLGDSEVFDPHARDVSAAQLEHMKLQNQLLRARLAAVKDGALPVEALVDLLTESSDADAMIGLDLT